jgi:hypothetical protein
MMKQEAKIFLVCILALVLSAFLFAAINSGIVNAQTSPSLSLEEQANQLQNLAQGVPQTPEEAKTVGKNYLLAEWKKIIANNTYTASFYKLYKSNEKWINPVFLYGVGAPPDLSWLFILIVILWVAFLTNINSVLAAFSTFSDTASIFIALGITIMLANLHAIRFVAQWIINILSMLSSWWMQLITLVILFILLLFVSAYSKEFKAIMKKWKEERKKAMDEEELQLMKIRQKHSEEFQKNLEKSLGGTLGEE